MAPVTLTAVPTVYLSLMAGVRHMIWVAVMLYMVQNQLRVCPIYMWVFCRLLLKF